MQLWTGLGITFVTETSIWVLCMRNHNNESVIIYLFVSVLCSAGIREIIVKK